eukprot:443461-Rhodomonas_salina.1
MTRSRGITSSIYSGAWPGHVTVGRRYTFGRVTGAVGWQVHFRVRGEQARGALRYSLSQAAHARAQKGTCRSSCESRSTTDTESTGVGGGGGGEDRGAEEGGAGHVPPHPTLPPYPICLPCLPTPLCPICLPYLHTHYLSSLSAYATCLCNMPTLSAYAWPAVCGTEIACGSRRSEMLWGARCPR